MPPLRWVCWPGCCSSSTAASSGSTAAAEDKYTPGTYSASKTISYSEIGVSMTFDANSITACEITSSGEQDLLTDDKKTAMAKAIVEGQSADVDAVTQLHAGGLRKTIQECVADCIAQATGTGVEKPAATTEVTGRVPGYSAAPATGWARLRPTRQTTKMQAPMM